MWLFLSSQCYVLPFTIILHTGLSLIKLYLPSFSFLFVCLFTFRKKKKARLVQTNEKLRDQSQCTCVSVPILLSSKPPRIRSHLVPDSRSQS